MIALLNLVVPLLCQNMMKFLVTGIMKLKLIIYQPMYCYNSSISLVVDEIIAHGKFSDMVYYP